jgi:hypothetical protein
MDAPSSVRPASLILDEAEVNLWLVWAIESYLLEARNISHSIRGRVKALLSRYPEPDNEPCGGEIGTRLDELSLLDGGGFTMQQVPRSELARQQMKE